jgi:polyketide cyclase/dehydrase/lipid transport protein
VPSFTLVAEVAAPPAVVFDVLTDHRGYAAISRIRSVELEREGDPAPNGVGAIRKLTAVGPPLREEVLAYEPHSRFAYTLLSGAPVRDHVGTVELSESTRGTRIDYRIDTTPTLPLLGRLVVAVARSSVNSLLKGIVRESERRAAVSA